MKLVRVFPERLDIGLYRDEAKRISEFHGSTVQLGTDDDIRASVLAHARERGWESGDVGRVVMASRMGDVGLSKILDATHGYSLRVYPECLEVIGDDEAERIVSEWKKSLTNRKR
jgi:hypothetical protein